MGEVAEDRCPECGADFDDLGIFVSSMNVEHGYYPCSCSNCGFEGRQWYKMKFASLQRPNENGVYEDYPGGK